MRRYYFFLLGTFLIVLITMDCAFGQRKILMIHSYGSDLLWVTEQERGIKNVLGPDTYRYYQFYMNTKKIPSKQFRDKAFEAVEYYKKIHPDFVFLTDDNALKYVGPFIEKDTPVVFSGINGHIRKDYPWVLNQKNITGIFERPAVKRVVVAMINALNLKIEKSLVIIGDSPTGKAIFCEALKESTHFNIGKRQVDVVVNGRFADWKSIILSAKTKGYGLIMSIANQRLTDSQGQIVSKNHVARWISEHSPVPFFTTHTAQIGKDMAVGGVGLNGLDMGKEAALLAKEILENKVPPSSLEFRNLDRLLMIFSRHELEKWQLKLAPEYKDKASIVD